MKNLHCVTCGKPLTGHLDTYGATGQEQCWQDWSLFLDWKRDAQPSVTLTYPDGHYIKYANGGIIEIGVEDDDASAASGAPARPTPEGD